MNRTTEQHDGQSQRRQQRKPTGQSKNPDFGNAVGQRTGINGEKENGKGIEHENNAQQKFRMGELKGNPAQGGGAGPGADQRNGLSRIKIAVIRIA